MYKKDSPFDKNNKERIYNLLILKGEVLIKGRVIAYKLGVNTDYHNFYTAMSDQIDSLLIYFLNDEISASLADRGPLKELLEELKNEHYKESDFKRLQIAKMDLKDLFVKRTDFIIGSLFLDFTVNTFSVFEKYMSDAYDDVIKKFPRSNKKEVTLKKLISKYVSEHEPLKKQGYLDKIKSINFYVSSSEKIDYVLSKCGLDSNEMKKVKSLVDFYRNKRNTIHNLGVNKSNSQCYTVENIEIRMDANDPSITDNWNSSVFLCRDLVKVYDGVVRDLYGILII